MSQALTESFCERCGTRYRIASPTRLNPLRRTRGVVAGLKNYLMSQDALGDAIGEAIRTEHDHLAARQLDAFGESFNFCMSCRQYTCVACWNGAMGCCRTCAPTEEGDEPTGIPASMPGVAVPAALGTPPATDAGPVPRAEEDAEGRVDTWPRSDLADRVGSFDPQRMTGRVIDLQAPMAAAPQSEAASAEEQSTAVEIALSVSDSAPPAAPSAPLPVILEEAIHEADAVPQPMLAGLAPEAVAAGSETESAPALVPVSWEQDVAFELEPVQLEPVQPEPVTPVADGVQRLEPPDTMRNAAEDAVMQSAVADEVLDEEVLADEVLADEVLAEEVLAEEVLPPAVLVETSAGQGIAAELPEPPENELDPEAAAGALTSAAQASPPHAAAESEGENVEPAVEPAVESAVEPAVEVAPSRGPLTPIGATIVRGGSVTPIGDRLAAEARDPSLDGRKAQFDLLGLEDPGRGTVAPAQSASLPYRSSGAAPHPSEGDASRRAEAESIWDASARQVAEGIGAVAIQSCDGCGLSLSASARFCRRCGTPQTRSA